MSYRVFPIHTAVHPVCPGYKMTIFDGGRLGNNMGEFATLLAQSKRLGFEPVLTPSMKKKFNEIFKNISFPGKRLNGKPYTVEELSNVTSCKQLPKTVKIDPVMFLKTYTVHEYYFNCWMLLNLQSYLSGNPMDLQSFHPYMEDIRRELTFKDEIALKADMFLDNIWQQNRPRLVTFVGVHVRGHEYQ